MAYYVAVETEKDNYTGINIRRCRQSFGKNYTYDEPHACTLQEINDITTTYKNEEEFKKALVASFALKLEYLDKPLAIIYNEGIETRIINGSILYENSRNLIESIDSVIKYVECKYTENDYKFFRELADCLREDSINKSIISQVASIIELKLASTNPAVNDLNIPEIITTSAKLLVYKNDINEKGIVSPTRKVDYEALHNLVSFITVYEQKLEKEKNSGFKKTFSKPE